MCAHREQTSIGMNDLLVTFLTVPRKEGLLGKLSWRLLIEHNRHMLYAHGETTV